MVMVLLFLGVVFLLIGLQAMGSDSTSSSSSSTVVSTITATPTSTAPASEEAEPVRPEVRVFNISEVAGAAETTANRLRDADWNVSETGNLVIEGVPVTTVYFGETPGEREAADEVGALLQAPVEPRSPAVAEQPPGVIVVVTG
jgi:hypothetical protein